MFEKSFITEAINRSAETDLDRRKLFTMVGVGGVAAATAVAAGGGALSASAADAPSDASVLNFALNLEYLEAEFYLNAVTGEGLSSASVGGVGRPGSVTGGKKVRFTSKAIERKAREIAKDEQAHVEFLRAALGGAAVARPQISLKSSFDAAATAAGLIKKGEHFDPYADDLSFLFAAFLFEDVGVTAYKGAAGFISNKTYLEAAAGILAVEAYHAGIVRSTLWDLGLDDSAVFKAVRAISDARDSLDGSVDDDKSIGKKSKANLVPTDSHGIAFSRTPSQVLNVVYLNPAAGTTQGGFYPNGMNGDITVS